MINRNQSHHTSSGSDIKMEDDVRDLLGVSKVSAFKKIATNSPPPPTQVQTQQ